MAKGFPESERWISHASHQDNLGRHFASKSSSVGLFAISCSARLKMELPEDALLLPSSGGKGVERERTLPSRKNPSRVFLSIKRMARVFE
ncbi:hypothetical protein J6590_049569 [Homalodisca vitripennis]|nr:hypothetical protein J6590_049569 [Homalodisca vitripennis]